MSCTSVPPTFRLLDAFIGWDVSGDRHDYKNLTGLDDPDGLRLDRQTPDAVDPNGVWRYIAPPRLARGCGPCEWYLVTPVPPSARLLRRDACSGTWLPVWSPNCDPGLLVEPAAAAARGHNLAIADHGAERVWIWTGGGEKLSAATAVSQPGPIAFAPWGELLVTVKGSTSILRFGANGDARGTLAAASPGEAETIAVSDDCSVWLVTRPSGGSLRLWRATRHQEAFEEASIEELAMAFPPTGLTAVSEVGFCMTDHDSGGVPVISCFSWYGRPVSESEIEHPSPPARHRQGQLLTQAIDSGIPRCRWHRVRIDADVPPGTVISVAVSTGEESDPTGQGDPNADPLWRDFPAGKPHRLDWQRPRAGSLDFLVDQPPGRYLFLRLRLTGDGRATPVVRRIRLDFPRVTSMEFLPPVYREEAEAEDFTERFLSLFDASIAELDRAIERAPALLDVDGAPDELLPWLGSFLDVAFDRGWEADRLRNILRAVPDLYRRRGTKEGLAQAIRLVFDAEPAIQELAAERSWGGLGDATRLGSVRLFGKSRARFRLGNSALSSAPLRSFGDPDTDPLTAQAYRFRVLVPPGRSVAPVDRDRLERLIASQKPAHTVASIRLGGEGFIIGGRSAVGVDTVLASLSPPVLGSNTRLHRMSILWHGPRGRRSGPVVGGTAIIGDKT
jgi:phage tail-like protein